MSSSTPRDLPPIRVTTILYPPDPPGQSVLKAGPRPDTFTLVPGMILINASTGDHLWHPRTWSQTIVTDDEDEQ